MKKLSFIILASIYILCSCNPNTRLWRIQEDGLYGFIDSVGNVIIKPQYKYVGNFRSGYACVISDIQLVHNNTRFKVKYGYIDADNNLVIDTTNIVVLNVEESKVDFPKRFADNQLNFREFAFAKLDLVDDRFIFQDDKTMKFGYKNSEGKVVIQPIYISAESFANGRAVVQDTINFKEAIKDGKIDYTVLNTCGAIDINGNKLVQSEYAYISPFSKNKNTWAYFLTHNETYDTFQKQWALIDENGKALIPPSPMWDHVYNSDEGLYVGQMNMFGILNYTFIDKTGNILTDYDHNGELTLSFEEGGESEVFSDVTSFSEGFAGIKGQYEKKKVWYFVDKTLNSNFTPYDSLQRYSEGLAAVKQYVDDSEDWNLNNMTWGYIDKNANIVIPYQFFDCGSFRGSLAYFKKWGSTYDIEGYINKQGKIVWQTEKKK